MIPNVQMSPYSKPSQHVYIRAAEIVHAIYGKDKLTEADRRLAATMSFIRFFSYDDCFDRRQFYDMCMKGTIAEAT